jgi:hypothetical protein
MAKWAWAVVVVSISSVGVGLVGIYFIKRTYDKTGEAVAAAQHGNRQAARAAIAAQNTVDAAIEANRFSERAFATEQRPWLVIDTSAKSGYVGGEHLYCDIEIVAKNVGKTPATHAVFDALSWRLDGMRIDLDALQEEYISKTKGKNNPFFRSIVSPVAPSTVVHKLTVPMTEVSVLSRSEDGAATRHLVIVACGVSYRGILDPGAVRHSIKFSVLTLVHMRQDPGSGHGGQSASLAHLSGGDLMT